MLRITYPGFCQNEIKYTLGVVFSEWLGISYKSRMNNKQQIIIKKEGANDIILKLAADFFINAHANWLSMETLPKPPLFFLDINKTLAQLNAINAVKLPDKIPVLYGDSYISVFNNSSIGNNTKIICRMDLLGGIFFMLSRYEEIVFPITDNHNRFPSTASIAYKADFLNRPIVNEYLELLWAMMKCLWPDLQRKERVFRMIPSHDVDRPFEDLFRSPYSMIRRAVGDISKRKNLQIAKQNYQRWRKVRKGNINEDRYNTFDFIMNESEKRSLTSAFYFLPRGSRDLAFNPGIDNKFIRNLIQKISERGHEIGLHGHYDTYKDGKSLQDDTKILRKILIEIGCEQIPLGGRQHYLRWKTPDTFQNWANAGFMYDSTLGYADYTGFRCGTCYDYVVYDVVKRTTLNLVERPLIAMDCTVTSDRYMGKGFGEQAFSVFKNLKDHCKLYNGNFTLLWHNSELSTHIEKQLYLRILDA
jgi:hypothetical protein